MWVDDVLSAKTVVKHCGLDLSVGRMQGIVLSGEVQRCGERAACGAADLTACQSSWRLGLLGRRSVRPGLQHVPVPGLVAGFLQRTRFVNVDSGLAYKVIAPTKGDGVEV